MPLYKPWRAALALRPEERGTRAAILVVRLAGGQLGVKQPYSIQPGIARIVLVDGSEQLLPKTTPVRLLARPEDLAAAYVQATNAIINRNGSGQP